MVIKSRILDWCDQQRAIEEYERSAERKKVDDLRKFILQKHYEEEETCNSE